ncbi:MAG: septum formation protein Maf [Candidatus Margulisiibacteriota bacterium]|nr:MAG: septum formation protein Maf [Candidatus Margulisiibacteriota bacterium]HAR63149.1 septum formation protein Maf [Candidatus Margulisiibacteriota bacterium]HCT84121.1 septum formation protein Maf [Candidatus Margulisiibacteriota bacterium]HCY36604.1 septum formation protein Maf [Candidatus Margulisiibacteriota bacterium]
MMLSILENKNIVLASASPRRKELLLKAGLTFTIIVADIDESISIEKPIENEICRLSVAKAAVVSNRHKGIIIAADTVVICDGSVLTKPKSLEDAKKKLMLLSGKVHDVLTAYTVRDTVSNKDITRCVKTEVTFFDMPEEFIDWYLSSGDYLDKAGAYAIQEKGMLLVKKIEGSYTNVVGLPVEYVFRDVIQLGIGE